MTFLTHLIRGAVTITMVCLLARPLALRAAEMNTGPASENSKRSAGVPAPLLVLYSERPPFMHKENDERVTGLAVDAALRAFAKADIAVNLREASPARRLREVKENKFPVCSLGFYATDERRTFARISRPVSQDGPMVAVSSVASPVTGPTTLKPAGDEKLETFLANPELKVLVKDSIVYGPYLEAQFARMQAQRVSANSEYAQLLTLLRAQRAHVLFMPQEEAEYYLPPEVEAGGPLKVIRFASIPAGETRHVLCSHQVSEATMALLNRALRADPKLARIKP